MSIDEPPDIQAGVEPLRKWPHSIEDIALLKKFEAENLEIARKIFLTMVMAHDLKSEECSLQPSVGIYKGGVAPAYILELKGEKTHIFGVLAEWGLCHDQEGIRIIYYSDEGPGFRYIIKLKKTLDYDTKAMKSFFRRIEKFELSATLVYDRYGRIQQVEYWGTALINQDERAAAQAIYDHLQESVGPKALEQPELHIHYEVQDIPSVEKAYEDFISESKAGRVIGRADCLQEYHLDE